MEAKLQKLKVTELKELLSKHNLPQTGKKDDLVKRLLENNVAPEGDDEELVDPDFEGEADANGGEAPQPGQSEETSTQQPAETSSTDQPSSTTAATETTTLTPDQQAMKARAERFGIPFNPNPTSTQRQKPASNAKSETKPAVAAEPTPAPKKEKAGAIDSAPVGISEEVLAKRAAKFGIPEKKESANGSNSNGKAADTPASATATKADKPAPASKPAAEITPEMAEKIAAEEEKKRKRAEKFGTGKPASSGAAAPTATENGAEEPESKKTKV